MDLSGSNVFSVVRFGSPEQRLALLQELKTHVKKDNVQLPWVGKYFEALSIAMDSLDVTTQTLAFSLVCHLVKRVSIQDLRGSVLLDQSFLVLPLLIPRIADPRTSVKVSAKRALEAYWLSCPRPVDLAVAEIGLANRSLLLVNESVAWLNYILTNVSPHFKLETFLDPLARILHERSTDERLVANVKVLLENYYDLKQNRIRKFDLQKALERNNVPARLRVSIMGTESIMSRPSELLFRSVSTSILPQVPQVQLAPQVPQIPQMPRNPRSTEFLQFSQLAKNSEIPQTPVLLQTPHAQQIPQVPQVSHGEEVRALIMRRASPSTPVCPERPKIHFAEPCISISLGSLNHLTESVETPGVNSDPWLNEFLSKLPNYAYDTNIEPINFSDAEEIHQMVSDMSPCFQNKETERNWSSREKSILKMRSVLRGNAPAEYLNDLTICIKELSEGICKSLLSLRTTLSVNSCQFVKELAFLLRKNFEPLVDLFIPTLIRLCSNTKHLTNINAHVAMCATLAECPLSPKLGQKILHAASEKSVNTKAFASSWLQIFIVRSHDLWKGSGSEIAEKVLLKLLPDPNMQVRLAAKDAYWKYHELAEELAVNLRTQLDSNINRALERSRPKSSTNSTLPGLTNTKSRPSLKDSIMAKKRELKNRQSISRTSSRHDLASSNETNNESVILNAFPRKFLRTPSLRDSARSRGSTPTHQNIDLKSSHDHATEKDFAKSCRSAQFPTERAMKSDPRNNTSPRSDNEPHYAQPTFSHPSPRLNTSQGKMLVEQNSELAAEISLIGHTAPKPRTSQIFLSSVPKLRNEQQAKSHNFELEDPICKFLASPDGQLLEEGIILLQSALSKGEDIPDVLSSSLKKLSIRNPHVLLPLFELNDTMLRKVMRLFTKEDFLRLTCILVEPTEEALDMIISLFTAEEIYSVMETMLSYVLELTDVVDDGLLIMQLIKFKDKILAMILRMLSYAATKVPITDVMLGKLANTLFELIPVIHQTNLMSEYKEPLCKLYAINSTLFVSQLSLVKESTRQELELLVGIDDLLQFKSTEATMFNMTDFTRVSPNKHLHHLSPLKYPSEFTKLLPKPEIKVESNILTEEKDMDLSDDAATNKDTGSVTDQRICLEEPPQMQVVPEEDIEMEDTNGNQSDSGKSNLDEFMKDGEVQIKTEERHDRSSPASGIKLEPGDFNVLRKSSPTVSVNCAIAKDVPNALVEDFASVKLSSQANSIETFIEKVDPLNKLSSRNKPIPIYDDSKAGSPQKVKDYDFTELNWFNFLMAKMSLDYGIDDLERYSKNDFRALCQKLSDGSANENSIATMMKYLRVPDPESLASFLRIEGYTLVENATFEYLNFEHSNLFEGLMIIKQLLVSRHALNATRAWSLLLDLSGAKSDEPLRALELAVGETFNEMLSGMYKSKVILQIVTQALLTWQELAYGSLRFALESLQKLMNMETLVLAISAEIVDSVDRAVRSLIGHDSAEIRKLVIEIYGRIHRAAKLSQGAGGQGEPTAEAAVQRVMLALTTPQQRIIEYFSQGK